MMHCFSFTKLVPVLLASASFASNVEGFAPARLQPNNIKHAHHTIKRWKNADRPNQGLNSSAASTVGINFNPTTEKQRTLNKFQSNIVRALMVTYIASMCVALPV